MLVGESPASWECRLGAARRALSPGYRRREPEATLLYSLVAEHLDALLLDLAAASPNGHGLPRHVEKELRALLDCGRLEDDVVADEPDQLLLFATRSPVARGAATPDNALPPRCARLGGFSLHANAAVHANDRQGVEALCRYGLRPPLAQSRLALDDDGHVLYRMKRTFADGTHTLRFTPRDFLLRLAALVPPPGFHMVRYFGQFAAHARGRRALASRGPRRLAAAGSADAAPGATTPPPALAAPLTSTAAGDGGSEQAVLQYAHDRDDTTVPEGPDDPARPRRLAWAALLRRAWRLDALACPKCGGRMALVAVILDPAVAGKIVRHLGLGTRAPPAARRLAPDPAGADAPFVE
jgi:hypothetical protein